MSVLEDFDFHPTAVANPPKHYRAWQDRARKLLEPLLNLMEEGRADLPIEGQASDHDANADRLESYARPLLLFAHWRYSLDVYSDDNDRNLSVAMENWFVKGLIAGTDPESPRFWGYAANFHQHSVEMGLMVIGLELSRSWLWDKMSADHRDQVLAWLESDVGNGHHWNNHMFFGIFVMEFLSKEGKGRPSYRAVIDRWFDELEGMYHGEGWFMDGMNQAFDFYNAYAWHFYSVWWILLYGEHDPVRCGLWASFTKTFLKDYIHFFATSGEHPAFGRSITYRFNATAPFGLAQLAGISDVDPVLARTICDRNLDFFIEKPIYQSQGCLSLGWYDEFIEMVETYSCGGSTYWAAKAFAPLLLKPDDPFWKEETRALPSEQSDFSKVFRIPCLITRATEGDVEIINAGSQIASVNTRFGPYKWGNLSYRSGFGFLIGVDKNHCPVDGGLTAENQKDDFVYGRHYTAPIAVENDHMACLYSLGQKFEQFQVSVETHMWWKAGWQLVLHQFISKQPAVLRHGGYALSSDSPDSFQVVRTQNDYVLTMTGERGVALQSIYGYGGFGCFERLRESDGPRQHIQAPFHSLAVLESEVGGESGVLVCLSWAGSTREEGMPWKVESLDSGNWHFSHPVLGDWLIRDEVLPALA